jgi:hypothetical protein
MFRKTYFHRKKERTMKYTDYAKQTLDWNKTVFNSSVNFIEKFQDYGEKTAGSLVELSPWGADESKKVLNQWSSNRKKGLKAFKESVAFGFKQAEGLCAAAKPAK